MSKIELSIELTTRWRSSECTETWRETRMPRGRRVIIKLFPISTCSECLLYLLHTVLSDKLKSNFYPEYCFYALRSSGLSNSKRSYKELDQSQPSIALPPGLPAHWAPGGAGDKQQRRQYQPLLPFLHYHILGLTLKTFSLVLNYYTNKENSASNQ